MEVYHDWSRGSGGLCERKGRWILLLLSLLSLLSLLLLLSVVCCWWWCRAVVRGVFVRGTTATAASTRLDALNALMAAAKVAADEFLATGVCEDNGLTVVFGYL